MARREGRLGGRLNDALVILASLASCAAVAVAYVAGYQIIVGHSLYIPMALAAFFWQRRAYFLLAFLVPFYLLSHVYFFGTLGLGAVLERMIVIVLVSIVLTELIYRLRRQQRSLIQINAVLKAIRNVNQLITREKERNRLIKGICERLIETQWYYGAWIILLDKNGRFLAAAEAGMGDGFASLVETAKRNEWPHCARRILDHSGVLAIEDVARECGDLCPLSLMGGGRGALAVCLGYGGRAYGVMAVYVPAWLVHDKVEQTLIADAAGDIAFALDTIEKEAHTARLEEKVFRGGEYLRRLIDSLPYPFYVVGTDGYTIKMANSILYEGELPAEITCYALTHKSAEPCKGPEHPCPLDTVKKTKKSFAVEHVHFDVDGNARVIEVNAHPIFDDGGGVKEVAITSMDVTERRLGGESLKKTAEGLRETISALDERGRMMMSMLEDVESSRHAIEFERSKLATAVAALPEGVVLVDEGGEVAFSNDAARSLFGKGAEESLGAADLRKAVWCPVDDVVNVVRASGRPYSMDLVTRRDPLRIVRMSAVPMVGEGSRMDVLFTFTDVTREREVDRTKEELITNISHEFHTPLSMIKIFLSSVLAGAIGPIDDRMRQGIESAGVNADRLAVLIEGLIEYSRLHKRRPKLAVKDVLAAQIIAGVQETYEAIAAEKGRNFRIRMDMSNPRLRCDPQRINQVIANLLDNAIKFTKEGGNIVLSVTDTQDEIEVGIKDDGVGIPREHHEAIFDGFRQVGRELVPGAKGLGLGLAICKEIVLRHGGRIWVESEPGEGSAFIFTLPREGPEPSEETLNPGGS